MNYLYLANELHLPRAVWFSGARDSPFAPPLFVETPPSISRCRSTTRENKQSILTTNAHVADINTDRLETMRVLQLVQKAGHFARRDSLRQCIGQNMSTKSKQFLSVHETRLLSTTSQGLYSLKTLTQLGG